MSASYTQPERPEWNMNGEQAVAEAMRFLAELRELGQLAMKQPPEVPNMIDPNDPVEQEIERLKRVALGLEQPVIPPVDNDEPASIDDDWHGARPLWLTEPPKSNRPASTPPIKLPRSLVVYQPNSYMPSGSHN